MKPRRFASATTFSISWSRGTVKLAPYSPPGEPAARAGRPPHTVGRRNANSMLPTRRARCAGWPTSPHGGEANASSILPTRRARCAGWPTSPHGGEAKCKLDTPHPASPLRGLADLPTRWGGECKLDAPHPASPLRGLADLPTRWGGEMQARCSPPGEPAALPGRPPHTVGRRNANSILPTRRGRCAAGPTSPQGGEAKKPIRVTLVEGLRGCCRPDP